MNRGLGIRSLLFNALYFNFQAQFPYYSSIFISFFFILFWCIISIKYHSLSRTSSEFWIRNQNWICLKSSKPSPMAPSWLHIINWTQSNSPIKLMKSLISSMCNGYIKSWDFQKMWYSVTHSLTILTKSLLNPWPLVESVY